MSVDRVSNMISALKNAALTGNSTIETYYSKECEGVAKVLKEKGFLDEVKVFKPKGKAYKGLRLDLAKQDDLIKLVDVQRISRPGRRLYVRHSEITPVAGGHGVLVVSTSRGIMSGEQAKIKKLGGEIVCKIK